MTIKDMIQEGQVTPKEVRALFQEILAPYTGKKPISVTVNYGKETVKFDFVKRRKRRRADGEPYDIIQIPYEDLNTTKAPGVYYAIDDFTIYRDKTIPFVYGLYISLKKERDLRFFNDVESCKQWLEKKINLLEK